MAGLTPEVEEAVAELRAAFSQNEVEVEPDNAGGAYVLVRDLPLGDQYRPARSWIGFQITFQYPHADVYPHFTDPTLARTDNQALGQGFARTKWHGRDVTQISRRSNQWNPAEDTAAIKLAKVLQWIVNQ